MISDRPTGFGSDRGGGTRSESNRQLFDSPVTLSRGVLLRENFGYKDEIEWDEWHKKTPGHTSPIVQNEHINWTWTSYLTRGQGNGPTATLTLTKSRRAWASNVIWGGDKPLGIYYYYVIWGGDKPLGILLLLFTSKSQSYHFKMPNLQRNYMSVFSSSLHF